jgi:double-strand break repair protein MRE11
MLREHVLGERPVEIEVVYDSDLNLHGAHREFTHENKNVNMQLPLFAIHGSHEEPSGHGILSALDILSAALYVNYFGKVHDVPENATVSLQPILIRKGSTQLALYGLEHMREQTFQKMLQKKVRVARPTVDPQQWFNVMAVHQKRSGATCAPLESLLPPCMDAVVWGHESKCEITSGIGDTDGNEFVVI